ncbi:hypothetical protein O8B93_27805 [Agrobacterium rhizogenes]|uniref:hypothetical protein n=1 Tax=Rhizobium rhizogenes TaxID=359 RepID=UPI0022B6A375|nr:hypothetical protein [Rhizobium rhizogenes]MCZ7451369.1 hypothetical protein [Rhizobium rhizogenes]
MTLHVKRLHHQGFTDRLQARRASKASNRAFVNTVRPDDAAPPASGGHRLNFSGNSTQNRRVRRQSIFRQ